MAKKKEENIDFETALNELESLVEKMESGELSLEDALQEFERGMKLTETCQNVLQQAELKVQTIKAQYRSPAENDIDD